MKYAFLASVFTLLSFNVHAVDVFGAVEITHLSPEKAERIWEREKQVMPRYPKAMAMKSVRGCSVFKFDVTEEGKVKNLELVSSLPEAKHFKPVKKLIKGWDWKVIEGKAKANEQKLVRLDFCMNRESSESVEAQCKAQTQLACE
ncbi:MAG: energy transducer TonB [Pseudomonadota bacterium]